MHATKLVNKRLLISFKKTQGFENVHRSIFLDEERLYTLMKKYFQHLHLNEQRY